MPFPENFITELVDRSDIVDVVSGYVRLSKRSGANLFGLCPFHSEKTPSFSVSPDKQIYHCFGCGKGGGVISFIMEIENLTFPEAVEFLARRAGMPVPEQTDDRESRRRERMLALNREAARWFYAQLSTPAGQSAGAYMAKRRISPATAKTFGLGCAPDGWDGLLRAMEQKGFTGKELFDAGLARRGKNGGYYDVFRNRLMFPVIDVRGNVIGFSGRILGDGEPKYMNSPETPVFNKSRNLFALNLAKKSKSGYIILSEGNIDVVSLHQAGFDSAVASLGTSLTPEQARLISRYTDQVIIAYDNDGAGVKAAQRAIGILEKLDLRVKVLRMSGAKDPDEFIQTKGPEAFRKLLEASENQVDYRLRSVTDKYDLTVDEQKVDFLKEATDLVARLPGAVERQVYAMRVASLAGIGADAVTAEVERRRKRLLSRARSDGERQQTRPERQAQPPDKDLRYADPSSAAAEEGLIRLLYLDPALGRSPELPPAEDFSSEALGHIYAAVRARIDAGSAVSTASLSEALTLQEMSLLVSILQKPELLSSGERALNDYIEKIRERKRLRAGSSDLRALAESLRERKGFKGKDV
ncbi:MAG: DNA primase [Oscillospiraceae bacterium]|nr:DNA primase [Oscillospiraceae bacterium]